MHSIAKLCYKLSLLLFLSSDVICDYWTDRSQLLEKDQQLTVGSSIILNGNEEIANERIMQLKINEVNEGFQDPSKFAPANHFFLSKPKIEQSEVFQIIKKLPKGASLHSHDTALVSQEFLFNLTYAENLYGCLLNDTFKLHFFNGITTSECDWNLLSDLRQKDASFNDYLQSQLTLVVDDPLNFYSDINAVWKTFSGIFRTVAGLLTYKPVWKEYFYQALKELYEDNVKYLEYRGTLPPVYDLEGNVYDEVAVVGMYYDVLQQFQQDFPDFYGARFIYAPSRRVDNATMDKYVNTFLKLKETYPDFIAGFDLVGQEDLGKPLMDFIPQLLQLQESSARFFFHSGETNWYDTSTDQNLFDAILLNTTRIGHGYALVKHSALAELVKQRKIAIEISPISNQVLKLVEDIRNHPGTILIANGFPVVITCDDPSFWGAKGLSYDWYMAFMGMAGKNADLRFLKQLALNSLVYGSMDDATLNDVMVKWNQSWDEFINSLSNVNYLNSIIVL